MDKTEIELFIKWIVYKPICLNASLLIDLFKQFQGIDLKEKEILENLPDLELPGLFLYEEKI